MIFILTQKTETKTQPEILAPAGDRDSFLAALAAGADAIYCGLKDYSARMAAENFNMLDLAHLSHMAHTRNVKVYVTLNALAKTAELEPLSETIDQLDRLVKADALIVQDLGIVNLAQMLGFKGQIHLSTLANVSFPQALALIKKKLPVTRVVVPRELSVDEIKQMAAACPKKMKLEVFVHGALCYGVSGRCYWSSFLGGKSGLRGRCVQPCRRRYTQGTRSERFFACNDLYLDVLVKPLLQIDQVAAWKIEGRKKGPHYVYNTVRGYRLLREIFNTAEEEADMETRQNKNSKKNEALFYLSNAFGRSGTHYNFLSQRPHNPIEIHNQTGSGLQVGVIKGERHKQYISPRIELFNDDVLRIGYEDDSGHMVVRVPKYIPKHGRFALKASPKNYPKAETPVFLIDRREAQLKNVLNELAVELDQLPRISVKPEHFQFRIARKKAPSTPVRQMTVYRRLNPSGVHPDAGLWLTKKGSHGLSLSFIKQLWLWLPPVIWPEDEIDWKNTVKTLLDKGARRFVINMPYQSVFFESHMNQSDLEIWSGPFCNTANPAALEVLKGLGMRGAVISPELGQEDYLDLSNHSPLPLGMVISGSFPLSISRIVCKDALKDLPFTSPMREQAWVKRYEADYWVFPNWMVDLKEHIPALTQAGYRMFIHFVEPIPKWVNLKNRPGLWNWGHGII